MRADLSNKNRIVVKIGTSSLIYPNGAINLAGIDELAFVLAALQNQGKEIILVSSGAIGVGMNKLNLKERPVEIPQQQAVAAVGQSELMTIYNQRFQSYSQQTAQILLTRDIIEFPQSRQNVSNTLEQLLTMGIIPIINENDTVAVDELDHLTKFGDNDQLSAIVAQLTKAELLIMLSDIDGFYSANPLNDPEAVLYSEINEITPELLEQASGKGSPYGTGGMTSKLKAAQRILDLNSHMLLANGKQPKIIFDLLAGEPVGTHFYQRTEDEQ
ncbi:glutamate 5-kinase [Enterococcus casseliflavus]|uniref:glutamate 5-kinase n=1 Tax=Enterococcus casseliflavus TaxID=37734 RepID=UPI00232F6478|nr:glutamate 5-kinase [Enterococcus casseliflavus]MDB1694186.1 glutamate 5-kinase [Enterococcus casseliflavus]MDB1697046.1 glutamate 5-kinase [Enterococcus casseliflavus]MDB1701557.1 glutamate 5-kinase [Enterococcus casseliflavus]MDB1704720.1 glutamate 5-kinase [Enterococcus casseliflavus]